MPTFKLAINMAGAISAGAYTAGVLDFLTEALDAWYAAKAAGLDVPAHDLRIECFSGASAGGMCAAISAMLLQDQFEHIHSTAPTPQPTTNRFYESWVNRIDIRPLLGSADLKPNQPVVSLLDSTIIDQIAAYALVPGAPLTQARAWVSPDLTLFLSLTNLRGVPYSLTGVAPGCIEQTTFFHGDRIQFRTVAPGVTPPAPLYSTTFTPPGASETLLQTAAKATGAFPVFLAPRTLPRREADFVPPIWESRSSSLQDDPPPVRPTFPPGLADPFRTVNVDGGVTNNDPFNYAHDFLAALAPAVDGDTLERDPCKADRAVLSIAPFPTTQPYPLDYDPVTGTGYNPGVESSIFKALPALFSALVAQSRFFGESLTHLMQQATFSHFVIAPVDDQLKQAQHAAAPTAPVLPALQCAALGAFGGFFERGFRAHDFTLGRRNCQRFLQEHFLLPAGNIVLQQTAAMVTPEHHAAVLAKYGHPAPHNDPAHPEAPAYAPCATQPPGVPEPWLPIIPLVTDELRVPITLPPRVKITRAALDEIMGLLGKRFKAVASAARATIQGDWRATFLRGFLWPGPAFIWLAGNSILRKKIVDALGPDYDPS